MILAPCLRFNKAMAPLCLGALLSGIVLSLGVPLVAMAKTSTYKIGSGDSIKVHVWQENDLTGVYPVSKEGYLTINWVEPIQIGGLTLEGAQKIVTQTLEQYVRKPVVTLSIEKYSSQKITVLGEVKNPGEYYLKNENSLLHVLLKEAGGLNPEVGTTASIVRLHDNLENTPPETITVNLDQLLKGDKEQNISLANGDTIFVPRFNGKSPGTAGGDRVLVVGEVNTPGSYNIRDGYTVLNAVLDAGNFTKFASRNRVKLVRGEGTEKKEFTIRLNDVLKSGDKAKDMAVQPGDFIIVNKSFL